MYQSIVTWNEVPTAEENTVITAKVAEMKAAGKTDGVAQVSWQGGPGVPPEVVQRSWTTQADAEEWQTFLNALVPPPASVVIFAE